MHAVEIYFLLACQTKYKHMFCLVFLVNAALLHREFAKYMKKEDIGFHSVSNFVFLRVVKIPR